MKQAEPHLHQLVNDNVVKIGLDTLRSEFEEYLRRKFKEEDLQIENGDLALEDGDFKTLPDIQFEDFDEFTKRFRDFTKFMMDKEMIPENKADIEKVINHGNMIVNQNSSIKEQSAQSIESNAEVESGSVNWAIWSVIVAVIIGIITIVIMLASM